MSIFTGTDGKRYFKDSRGGFREINVSTDLGVSNTPEVQHTEAPAKAFSGSERGGYGNAQPQGCDDPAYIRDHYPSQRGIDGEPIEHAGSANHPLNHLTGWLCDIPYRPTRLPEEIVAEQNAIAAAEMAAEQEKQ